MNKIFVSRDKIISDSLNVKIEDNNIKQLNKIKNKLKNISIFCDYLSFKNNFVVIIKKEQFDYSNGIINKYLQN